MPPPSFFYGGEALLRAVCSAEADVLEDMDMKNEAYKISVRHCSRTVPKFTHLSCVVLC